MPLIISTYSFMCSKHNLDYCGMIKESLSSIKWIKCCPFSCQQSYSCSIKAITRVISLPYFSCRHTQKAVTSVPHKKSLGLIALTCLCFEEPLRCAGSVFNVSPLEAAYSCSPLLLRKNQLPLVGFDPSPHNPVYSQTLQHCAIFKHASVPCAHTRNLSVATAIT